MKKVLLATSALTLSAGFASADVSMSGTGGAGVFGAAGADLSVYSGVDLGFALSGASDNGMTFSASLDMGGGQTLDTGDFELDTQDMGTDDNVSVAIGVSGLTITLSQDGVDDLYDYDIAGDIGISGAMGDLTYSVVTGLEDADPTSLSIGYSAGAISGSVATSDEGDASTVTVTYAMGDITVSAESDTDRTGADTSSCSFSKLKIEVNPSLIIFGPPTPYNSTLCVFFKAEIIFAPNLSPEYSPATIPTLIIGFSEFTYLKIPRLESLIDLI